MVQRIVDSSNGLVTTEDENQSISAFSAFQTQYGFQAAVAMAQTMLALREDLSDSEKQYMLSTYTGAPIEPIKKHINEVMDIIGGMVQYHPPYISKNMEEKPGYFKLLLKTSIVTTKELIVKKRVIEVKRNLVIETASTKIVEYFLTVMGTQGWFDLPKPITCFFTGTQDEGYAVAMLSPDELASVQEILDGVE